MLEEPKAKDCLEGHRPSFCHRVLAADLHGSTPVSSVGRSGEEWGWETTWPTRKFKVKPDVHSRDFPKTINNCLAVSCVSEAVRCVGVPVNWGTVGRGRRLVALAVLRQAGRATGRQRLYSNKGTQEWRHVPKVEGRMRAFRVVHQ
jgi:hypothetical protein